MLFRSLTSAGRSAALGSNLYVDNSGNNVYITTGYASTYTQYEGAHSWSTASSGTAGNPITFTQAMTLDAIGNLGVGTTSPNTTLHVQGSSQTDGSIVFNQQLNSTTAYNAGAASGTQVGLKYTSGGAYAGMGGWTVGKENGTDGNYASYFAMYTRANGGAITERARINSSGYFKASNTGTYVGSTGAYHEFVSDGTSNTLVVRNSSTSSITDGTIFISNARNTTNGTYNIIGAYNTTAAAFKFAVLDSGNVQNTNNSYGALSDIKLKENIIDATPKLEKLNQVRVVNYNFIGNDQKQIGVVAQELEQIFPSMVEETPDRDGEGNILETTTKSVKYSVFVPMLIKAIQEQQVIIEQLKADVAALKGQA